MTRRTEMNLNQWTLWAALATGALLLPGAGAHASSKAKTFEQAVVEAQDLKSCKKKERFPIHRAHLAVPVHPAAITPAAVPAVAAV